MGAAAGLRPCEIDVTLGGIVYTIPALPAADWLIAIIGEPGAILPGLLPDDQQREVYDRLLSGDLDVAEINSGWRDVLGAAAGRSWWSASRLCSSAADPEAWPTVHGRLLAEGIDLDKVSIGGFCNAVFFMALSSAADDEERSKLKFELELPPPGSEVEAFEDRDAVANDFMAAVAQLQQLG